MADHLALRDSCFKTIYCNFSTHDCIASEIRFRQRAKADGDAALEDFLAANILRRRLRYARRDYAKPVAALLELGKNLEGSAPGTPDALLAAYALRLSCCAMSRQNAPSVGTGGQWGPLLPMRGGLLERADRLLGVPPREHEPGGLFTNAFDSVRTAQLNESMNQGDKDLRWMLEQVESIIAVVPYSLPIYFDRASHARRFLLANQASLDAVDVLRFYEETVALAAKSTDALHLLPAPGKGYDYDLLSLSVPPSSGLLLAVREFELAKAVLDLASAGARPAVPVKALIDELETVEQSRFDRLY